MLFDGLPDLEHALVGGDEHGLAQLEAADVAGVEAAGDALQAGEVEVDGALGRADGLDVAHDGLAGRVLEAEPEAAGGDVGRGDGLGLEGEELLGRRRLGPGAGDARDEAGAVHGEREREVVLYVGDRGEPEPGARRVLQVGAGVGYVAYAHVCWWWWWWW